MMRPVLIFAVCLVSAGLAGSARAEDSPGATVPAEQSPPVEQKSPAEAISQQTEAAAAKTKEAGLSFRDDMVGLPWHVWDDVQGLPNWKNAAALAVGTALSAYSSEEWDARVRADVRNHPDRLGRTTNNVLDVVANGYVFYAISGATYGVSLFADSQRLHDFALDQVSALTMELPVVEALKLGFHTRRPNGDTQGFPSGHAAAAASFGALLNRYYGPVAGIAGAGFAGLVMFHRIDSRNHDLSDVIFGGTLGYIAGRTAGDVEEVPVIKAHLAPFNEERGEHGFALEWRF